MSSQRTARRSCSPTIIHAIAELTRDACLVMDTDAVILEANDEAAQLYGYRTADFVGMHISELLATESSPTLGEALLAARGDGLLFTSTHMHKDGTTLPVEIGWKQSSIDCCELLVAHVRDISERVRLESDLRLRSDVLDAALDTIVVHDLDGNLLLANGAAAARAGMTHEEFMRLGPWGWVAEESRSTVADRLELVVENGAHVFETADVAADGTTHNDEIHASVAQLGSDKVVISVGRDITESVKATEMMRRMALSDPLTGLANRAHFTRELERAIADARRHGDALAVLYLDLDDFKPTGERSVGPRCGRPGSCRPREECDIRSARD